MFGSMTAIPPCRHKTNSCMKDRQKKMFLYITFLTVTVMSASSEKSQQQSISGYNKTLCKQFEKGNSDKMELYSPNYPSLYPNGTDCFSIIQGPAGYLVRLDFRDEFVMEASEGCQYDYLEVRDGGHGYSSLIGKYCGNEFPPMITSTSRRLWLRFHSDESIEHKGFRAVYSFIPRPTSESWVPEVAACRMEVDGLEGYVNSSLVARHHLLTAQSYNLPLDCVWVITVDPGWRIQLNFSRFQLKRPNDCESNFVDVFGDRTDLPSRLHNFCGSMAELVLSPSNVLQLRFFLLPSSIDSHFDALFTAFRDKSKDSPCGEDMYDCEDGLCISILLKCNGRVNCRLRWDEDSSECQKKPNIMSRIMGTEHLLIILSVFFLILAGMCTAFFCNCCRRIRRDIRMNKEEKRSRQLEKNKELKRVCQESMYQNKVGPDCYLPEGGELVLVPIRHTSETKVPPQVFTTFSVEPEPALAPDVIKTH